jgi:hypothetical protein
MNKKGVMFTLIAIIISSFLTVLFSSTDSPVDYSIGIVELRVGILNDYSKSFFEYAESSASMSGYYALYGVINNISMNNPKQYDANFENHFINCTITGNITAGVPCSGMKNKTLPYFLDSLINISRDVLKITSNYTINSINVTQIDDPFHLDVILNISLRVNDAFANISATRIIVSKVTISGLQDPLFLVNGTYNQTVKMTTLKKVQGDWNSTDLEWLYNNHEYRAYSLGISFINRIKGNLTPSLQGIESFINQSQVASGISLSMIDYFFLNKTYLNCTNGELVRINSTALPNIGLTNPNGLQIDSSHALAFFNMSRSGLLINKSTWCP